MSDDIQTPSQSIINGNPANKRTVLTTPEGKKVKVKTLSYSEQMKITRAVGPFHSHNVVYCEMVETIFMIVSVDGNYPAEPLNQNDIDNAADSLGDDVLDTVHRWRRRQLDAAAAATEQLVREQNQQKAMKDAKSHDNEE